MDCTLEEAWNGTEYMLSRYSDLTCKKKIIAEFFEKFKGYSFQKTGGVSGNPLRVRAVKNTSNGNQSETLWVSTGTEEIAEAERLNNYVNGLFDAL